LKGNSPSEVVQSCDITFASVSDTAALKDVCYMFQLTIYWRMTVCLANMPTVFGVVAHLCMELVKYVMTNLHLLTI